MRIAIALAFVLAFGIAPLYGCARLSNGSQNSYENLQSNPKQSDDQNDQAVLAQLRAKGSDLSKPTDVAFYLYIPARRDADSAAQVLRNSGYTAEVQEPLGKLSDGTYESRYSVVAHIQEVPSMHNLKMNRALYKSLAQRYKGLYDGWEAAIAQ
jgi:rhodanese-related sulfurtransferase